MAPLGVACDRHSDVLVDPAIGVLVKGKEFPQIVGHHVHDGPDLEIIVKILTFAVRPRRASN